MNEQRAADSVSVLDYENRGMVGSETRPSIGAHAIVRRPVAYLPR